MKKNIHSKKDHIIECAKVLFSKKGYHATSLPDIAKAANVSVGSIYYTFENKEDILLGIAQKFLDVHSEVFLSVGDIEDPLEKFTKSVTGLYRAMERGYLLIRIGYKDLSFVDKNTREKILSFEKDTNEKIAEIIRQGQEEGSFSKNVDPSLMAFNVIGLGHLWALKKSKTYKTEITVDQYISMQLSYFISLLAPNKDVDK